MVGRPPADHRPWQVGGLPMTSRWAGDDKRVPSDDKELAANDNQVGWSDKSIIAEPGDQARLPPSTLRTRTAKSVPHR